MKVLPAIFSAVLAVSFSSLAAAQGANSTSPNNPAATPSMDKDRVNAGAGATDDMDKKKGKSAKKSAKKSSKSKNKQSKAAGGASAASGSSSAETNADGRGASNTSSPSQSTGTPGSANQGSVHNDQTKK